MCYVFSSSRCYFRKRKLCGLFKDSVPFWFFKRLNHQYMLSCLSVSDSDSQKTCSVACFVSGSLPTNVDDQAFDALRPFFFSTHPDRALFKIRSHKSKILSASPFLDICFQSLLHKRLGLSLKSLLYQRIAPVWLMWFGITSWPIIIICSVSSLFS